MCIGTKSPRLLPQPVPSFKIKGCCIGDVVRSFLTELVRQDRCAGVEQLVVMMFECLHVFFWIPGLVPE